MRAHPTEIPGLLRIELKAYPDDRGFFQERFRASNFREMGLPEFVQENHSRSLPGVVRGLHFQFDPAQGKLVGVLRGRIFDVAVDLRPGSVTFGKWAGFELRDDPAELLWVPAGFAHGFCVLGAEPADVVYKVDAYWAPANESGIVWNDPELGIPWPVKNPVVSPKDAALPSFKDVRGRLKDE
jgi:dTDP-4-dehydrorhamnose 3,5-epimerase